MRRRAALSTLEAAANSCGAGMGEARGVQECGEDTT